MEHWLLDLYDLLCRTLVRPDQGFLSTADQNASSAKNMGEEVTLDGGLHEDTSGLEFQPHESGLKLTTRPLPGGV